MATKVLTINTPVKQKRKSEVAKLKTSVALSITENKKTRISKLSTKGMRSILGDSAEDIQQLLEVGKNESATSLIQKRLLQSLVDVLPYAEHNIRTTKGGKGVYQFNSLITSLREVLIDVQSTKDKGALGDALVEKILRPVFLDLAMMLIQENEKLNGETKDLVSPEAYKELRKGRAESLERVAAFVQGKYGEVKQQAVAFLQQ